MFGRRVSLRNNGGNSTMTIPRALCRHLNLKFGTKYDMVFDPVEQKITVDHTTAEHSKLFDPPAKVAETAAA
jgi:hypothetical protein